MTYNVFGGTLNLAQSVTFNLSFKFCFTIVILSLL